MLVGSPVGSSMTRSPASGDPILVFSEAASDNRIPLSLVVEFAVIDDDALSDLRDFRCMISFVNFLTTFGGISRNSG